MICLSFGYTTVKLVRSYAKYAKPSSSSELHRKLFDSFSCICVVSRTFAAVAKKATTARPLKRIKGNDSRDNLDHFVDWKQMVVQAGNGGNGMSSFLSLPMTEFAGPDGGDGGNGGHVIFQATHDEKNLNHLNTDMYGKNGENGHSKNCHGKSAEHTIIKVPLGTMFRDDTNTVVAKLMKEDERFLAARGGAGGKGNAFFLTNESRAPQIRELGGHGQRKAYTVEMRVMAHVGLVGFPNAGKSSLLCAISRARPKVASYPFTTLHPYVGIIDYEDYVQLAVADLPGLIDDAHKNHGLGVDFLRHIERCVCLLYVIDLSQPEPWLQLEHLRYELDQYKPGLSDQPSAIVGNKIDLPEAQKNLPLFEAEVKFPVIPISAMKGSNLTALLLHMRKLYDDNYQQYLAMISEEDKDKDDD